MRAFYLAYSEEAEFVTQPMSQIPWGHNITLFQKVKNAEQRLWYATQTLTYGWSRVILDHQIDTDLYGQQGKVFTKGSSLDRLMQMNIVSVAKPQARNRIFTYDAYIKILNEGTEPVS